MEKPPASISLEKQNIPHQVFVHETPVNSLEQAAADRNQRPELDVRRGQVYVATACGYPDRLSRVCNGVRFCSQFARRRFALVGTGVSKHSKRVRARLRLSRCAQRRRDAANGLVRALSVALYSCACAAEIARRDTVAAGRERLVFRLETNEKTRRE